METIKLLDPEKTIKINKNPFMPFVLLKGLWLSIARPSINSPEGIVFNKFTSCHNNIELDLKKIEHFKKICHSSKTSNAVPMVYLQSLFIGLLGKYIVSPLFPLIPMGLIHTKQKIVQKRKISKNEILNTKLTLSEVNFDSKGFETIFSLEITSKGEVVWEGVSTFLTKNKNYRKKTKPAQSFDMLTPFTSIDIPGNIGREYAKASGDCNPHHLSKIFAKLFGFKRAIAHGMWTLAKSVAEIENQFIENEIFSVDVSFKKPLFLPGKASLGAVKKDNDIIFELRDYATKIPHLAGTIQTIKE